MSVLDAKGAEVWRSEEMTIIASFAPNSIEILRDDLSELLLSTLPRNVETIYGDSITTLEDRADSVFVTFDKGPSRKFDLVVGADGIGSKIRNSILGADPACLHPFGSALAIYSAPNILNLENWQQSYELGGGERCLIYTARENQKLRVLFAFAAELADLPPDRPGQLALVKERCGRWGWEVPRLLRHMDTATDFYLGPMAQVRAPYWTKGRVATLGDAAFCPSPYTGQGSSLAVVGAYVLASELARTPADHTAAFERYEATLRPFVEKNQALADLSLDPRFSDPEYYTGVFEPALREAQDAIELEGLP
jgi:2-polyprenyl-6-methoxyphenol hydroxylase-like FAD-dependent oxidoreductase